MNKTDIEYIKIYCKKDDEHYEIDMSVVNVYFSTTGNIGHNAGHGEKGIVIDCVCGDRHYITFNSW